MASSVARPLRVGIVGGGIGGPACAQLLRARTSAQSTRRKIDVVLFERDSTAGQRQQGYYLGINERTFETLAPVLPNMPLLRYDKDKNASAKFAFHRRTGAPIMQFAVPADNAFVDRTNFRNELSAGLVNVQWGKKFVKYEPNGEGSGVRVCFADGSAEVVDVLVGADGANSSVRRLRAPAITYRDLNITNVAACAPLDDPGMPAMVRDAVVHPKGGSMLARWLGTDGHTVMMFAYHPAVGSSAGHGQSTPGSAGTHTPAADTGTQPPSELLWVLSYPGKAEDWKGKYSGVGEDTSDEYGKSIHARAQLLADCCERIRKHINPTLADAVALTGKYPDHPQYGLVGLYGPRQICSVDPKDVATQLNPEVGSVHERVVLLGDAAHASTTHRGLGANTAILDASDLANTLISIANNPSDDPKQLAKALRDYESIMVKRGQQKIKDSTQSTGMIHDAGFFGRHIREPVLATIGTLMRWLGKSG